MKVIAFAASTSKNSINKKLATYATTLLEGEGDEVEILDLNDYELPLFSEDKEKEIGKPKQAQDFLAKITESDAIIISFAEHNGSYAASYKNIFDWCSRINPKVFQGKSMLLLATSPGARGGATVLELAKNSAPFFDGKVKASLAVPSFYQNCDVESGKISNDEFDAKLKEAVQALKG